MSDYLMLKDLVTMKRKEGRTAPASARWSSMYPKLATASAKRVGLETEFARSIKAYEKAAQPRMEYSEH